MVHIDKKLTEAVFKIANALKLKKNSYSILKKAKVHVDTKGNLCITLNDLKTEVTIIAKQAPNNFISFLIDLDNKLWNKFKDINVDILEVDDDTGVTKLRVSHDNLSQEIITDSIDEYPVPEIYEEKRFGLLQLIEDIDLNIKFPNKDVLKYYQKKYYDTGSDLAIGLNEDTIVFTDGYFMTFYSTNNELASSEIPMYKVMIDRDVLSLALFEWTKAREYIVNGKDVRYTVIHGKDENFKYRIVTRVHQHIPAYNTIFKPYKDLDKDKYIIINKYDKINKVITNQDYLWIKHSPDRAYINIFEDDDVITIDSIRKNNIGKRNIGIKGEIFNLMCNIAKSHKNKQIKINVDDTSSHTYLYFYSQNGERYSLSIFMNTYSDDN